MSKKKISALLSSAVFCLQKSVSDFIFNLFCSDIKGFYQSSLGNEIDFRDIMNIFLNILAKNYNFEKLRHGFVDERGMIKAALSTCHCTTLVPFCLRKKRPENALLSLTVNYSKILQKNKLCLFSHCLFWLKNWRFSKNSCKDLLYP